MENTEIICVNDGKTKIYYSAVKIAVEHLSGSGGVVKLEGAIPNSRVEEFCCCEKWEKSYLEGGLDGEIKQFDPRAGVCLLVERYSRGLLSGERRVFYPNGSLHLEEKYAEGKLDGEAKEYYPSGNLRCEDSYEKGVLALRREYPDSLVLSGSPGNGGAARVSAKPQPQEFKAETAVPAARPKAAEPQKPAAETRPGELKIVRKLTEDSRIYFINDKESAREILGKNGAVAEVVGEIPDGLVREYYRNGQLKLEEFYQAGRPHGARKKYDEMGRLWAEETFVNGKLEGPVRIHNYFKDKVFEEEANFKNDKLNGSRRTFFPDGKLSIEENYLDGRLEGTRKSHYDSGKLNTEENYKSDRLNGPRKRYYENGQLWNEENYAEGKLEGLRKDYYPTGVLRLEEYYRNGRLDDERKFYYDNGHMMYLETYSAGRLIERKDFKAKA